MDPRQLAAKEDVDAPNVGEAPRDTPVAPDTTGSQGQAKTAVPAGPPPLRPGERACPGCGDANPQSRRFCVGCGIKLPDLLPADEPAAAAAAETGPRQRRSLRQMLGKTERVPGSSHARVRAGRMVPEELRHKAAVAGSWRQRAQAVAGRSGLKYESGFSTKAKVGAAAGLVVVLLAAFAVLGPGREKVMALVGRGPGGEPPAAAELIPAGDATGQGEERGDGEGQDAAEALEVAGFPAANILDDDELTGAGIAWDPEAELAAARFLLTLEEPTDVREILVAPGLPDDAEDGPLVRKPSRLQVCSDTGSCQELELSDSSSLQSHDIDLGDGVTSIEVSVVGVHEVDHTTYPLAVVSEVRIGS